MKLGIALGGGAAKGFAHIGILKTFQNAGIEFDIVTGTSIGALVGAVYAAGNLSELEAQAIDVSIVDIPMLLSPALSKSGFLSGKNVLELLSVIIGVKNIEDLPKKFAAVSVDLISGKLQVHTSGDLEQAVRASIAIPVVFTPVETQEMILVDGGLLEPVPVEQCRALGADFVIAVDLFGVEGSSGERDNKDSNLEESVRTSSKLLKKKLFPKELQSALDYFRSASEKLPIPEFLPVGKRNSKPRHSLNLIEIMESTLAISQRSLTAARLAEHPADILIQPPVAEIGSLDFHRAKPVIELGEIAAKSALEKLQNLKSLRV